jgi:uncharacterized protein YegP (UPF0339 family)
MRKPTIEFYVDEAGEHRWRVKAGNGEIIGSSSEGFSEKAKAVGNALLLANALSELLTDPAMETKPSGSLYPIVPDAEGAEAD